MKLLVTRELVDGTPRRKLTQADKIRIWVAHDHRCVECGGAVDCVTHRVEYDHLIPLALNGPDTDDNIGPIHTTPCHKIKTRRDKRLIAKAKRQRRMIEEPRASRRPLLGRGFVKHLTRGFNGLVRRRPRDAR